jgi:hypothetical protein
MNAGLEDAELYDGVLLLKVDALEEVCVLPTLSHRELKNTRVNVVLDDIVQLSVAVEVGKMVAPQVDEDCLHAARLGLNVSDHLVRAFKGLLRAIKGVDDVTYVRVKVVHLVRGLAELFTELLDEGDSLGETLELGCSDTGQCLNSGARLHVGTLLGGGLCLI